MVSSSPPRSTAQPWPEARYRRRRARKALALLLVAAWLSALPTGWRCALRGGAGAAGAARSPGGVGAAPITVDLASADAPRLCLLPGIGPARARALLADRARFGPPHRLADLERVPGLGRATIQGLRRAQHVRVVLAGRPVGCGNERSPRP